MEGWAGAWGGGRVLWLLGSKCRRTPGGHACVHPVEALDAWGSEAHPGRALPSGPCPAVPHAPTLGIARPSQFHWGSQSRAIQKAPREGPGRLWC